MSYQFIKPTTVKRYVHGEGKRITKIFLHALDNLIKNKLDKAITTHDGGRKTLDKDTAIVINLYYEEGSNGTRK